MRRIASLIGSTATLDEVLKYSLQDAARLLAAERAAIFLLDENRGALRLHSNSLLGIPPELALQIGSLPTDDPQYRQTITEQQAAYLSDDALEDTELLPVYSHMARPMDIRALMIVPLIVRERAIGELVFGSQKPGLFHNGDHLAARQREADFRVPNGIETLQLNGEKVRALFDWGKRLVDTAARQPELFNDHKAERVAAYVELLETLLATLGETNGFEADRSGRARQAQSRIVKIAEDYALSKSGERLFVSDLCRAAAVSERTLENAFKEVMGLTPMNYLVRLRRHRVRQSLLAGTQGTTTVSAEAMNWGFWHFGEFSRAYRDCFGELPSDTLRRRPDEAQQ